MIAFTPNCTLPSDGIAWVSSPNIRGTLDILWSCLSVILICTWSVLHLNVPEQTKPVGWRQQLGRITSRLSCSILWMMVNVLAPEWALGKAWADYCAVESVEKKFESYAKEDEDDVPWTKKHTYFANMGGFVIKFNQDTPMASDDSANEELKYDGSKAGATGVNASEVNESVDSEGTSPGTDSSGIAETVNSRTKISSEPVDDIPDGHISTPADALSATSSRVTAHQGADSSLPSTVVPSGLATDAHHDGNSNPHPTDMSPDPDHLSGALELEQLPQERSTRGLDLNAAEAPCNVLQPQINQQYHILNRNHQPKRRNYVSRTYKGHMLWKEDDRNLALVSEKTETVGKSDFPTDREQRSFRRFWMLWWVNAQALRGDTWVLDANQLLLARQMGIIDKLPSLAEDDLDDRNKSDLFLKLFAIAQLVWFVIQLLVRLIRGVSTTQLEIVTFAFAVCTAFTYCLLKNKPKDARYSISIPAIRHANASEIARIAVNGPMIVGFWRMSPWIPNNTVHQNMEGPPGSGNINMGIGAGAGVFVFGCLHFIAWSFVFPTNVERIIWITSSFVTALALPTAVLIMTLSRVVLRCASRETKSSVERTRSTLFNALNITLSGVFAVARMFIIVEAIRSLAFLPPDAFRTTPWAEMIPHLG